METFRQKLKARVIGLAAVILAMNIVYLALAVFGEKLFILSGVIPEHMRAFTSGAISGLTLFLVIRLIVAAVSLRSPEAVKSRYIKENDERKQMIHQKTGSLGFQIAGVGLGFAAVVAGFFDETIFFTLLCALLFLALVKASLRLYFGRKY